MRQVDSFVLLRMHIIYLGSLSEFSHYHGNEYRRLPGSTYIFTITVPDIYTTGICVFEVKRTMGSDKHYSLSKKPKVTVAIPTLNEEVFIEDVIRTFLDDSYDGEIEILVADGGSNDETVNIVSRLSEEFQQVKLLENPDKNQVFAFNIMLEEASGELFMLAGAHAEYPQNYISKCVELIKTKDALNVGGATRLAAQNTVQAGILFATYSFLGNGGANHKKMNYSGYTDTLFPGFYITQALKDVGGFNTQNISNQDTEINMRLSRLSDKAHYLSGDIKVYYYPRSKYLSLLKQYFRYGRGRCITTFRHPKQAPIRAYLSFVVVWVIFALSVLLLVNDHIDQLFQMIGFLTLLIVVDVGKTYSELSRYLEPEFWKGGSKSKPELSGMAVLSVPAVISMHIGMWSGFTYQLLKNTLRRKNKW